MAAPAALAPLPGPRTPLEVVREWDLESGYQEWRPQILVPPDVSLEPAPLKGHRTYVVVNQKGGAGKTTTAVELACAWVAMGYVVRIIDADPQDASLTGWLHPQYPEDVPEHERRELKDVFYGRAGLDQATYYTAYENLYLVPSTQDMAIVEYDPQVARETILRTAIRKSQAPVDITIIDSPPSLGKLCVAGLVAADEVLVPLKVGALDKLGLNSLHKTIRATQEEANPQLRVAGALLTAWDKSNYARQLAERVRQDYPEAWVAPIRRTVKAAEAPEHGQPVRVFAPETTTAADYDQVARIVLPSRGAAA